MKDLLTHVSRTTSRGVKKVERGMVGGGEGGQEGRGNVPRAVDAVSHPDNYLVVETGANPRGTAVKRRNERSKSIFIGGVP